MIVYSLKPDKENKKIFVLDESNTVLIEGKSNINVLDMFIGRGDKKAATWVSPAIKWFDDGSNIEKYKNPDITYALSSAALVLSPETMQCVQHMISDVVELLPLSFKGEVWGFMNVFNQVSALDKANSQYKIYSNGKVGWLIKPAFLVDKVPYNKLFKISEDPGTIYFAEENSDDSENNFKYIVEKNKLFGIKFIKVWEG